ncbi:MAG: hypothetical protein HYY44_03905 [Deltaproteobacteria bacterium]|nr:hypothetical protein [Deltaproteobacteria bacterium]
MRRRQSVGEDVSHLLALTEAIAKTHPDPSVKGVAETLAGEMNALQRLAHEGAYVALRKMSSEALLERLDEVVASGHFQMINYVTNVLAERASEEPAIGDRLAHHEASVVRYIFFMDDQVNGTILPRHWGSQRAMILTDLRSNKTDVKMFAWLILKMFRDAGIPDAILLYHEIYLETTDPFLKMLFEGKIELPGTP